MIGGGNEIRSATLKSVTIVGYGDNATHNAAENSFNLELMK